MRMKYQLAAIAVIAGLHAPVAQSAPATQATMASVPVQVGGVEGTANFDGVVESIRETVIASQVQGAVTEVLVRTGDTVQSGQVLVRIDARAASQNTAASQAQVQAARTALTVATKEYERQKVLLDKQYISQAAFERAEAQYRATSAQLNAQIAQANATQIQSGFFVVKAPYAGVISAVPVALGDMAMPGRPLLTIYDPALLRVTAFVPQSALAAIGDGKGTRIEIPALPAERKWIDRLRVQVLPNYDANTHTAEVRATLPDGVAGITPGMFARIWLPAGADATGSRARLYVPAGAVVRRAELTAVYVVAANGRPVLRQVRLGRVQDGVIEVLSGIAAGERVATDPQVAARIR